MKQTLFELDCMLLAGRFQALHTLLAGKGRTYQLIPINFTTLQDRANRDQYLKLCQTMPELYPPLPALRAARGPRRDAGGARLSRSR
ncbi:MAG: hypothetical protein WDN69_04795 [Aliidongia sp.]